MLQVGVGHGSQELLGLHDGGAGFFSHDWIPGGRHTKTAGSRQTHGVLS